MVTMLELYHPPYKFTPYNRPLLSKDRSPLDQLSINQLFWEETMHNNLSMHIRAKTEHLVWEKNHKFYFLALSLSTHQSVSTKIINNNAAFLSFEIILRLCRYLTFYCFQNNRSHSHIEIDALEDGLKEEKLPLAYSSIKLKPEVDKVLRLVKYLTGFW